jgi:O-antigen/teichoic acid export membrane protein
VTGGKLLSLGALFVGSLLVARTALDPGEYGLYAAGLSLSLLLDAVLGSPLDLSTVSYAARHVGNPARGQGFQAVAFRAKLILGLVLLLVTWLRARPLAAALLGRSDRHGVLESAVLCAVALLLFRSSALRLQMEGRFPRYSALDATHAALRLLALAGPLLLGRRSAEAFLLAQAAATTLAFVLGLSRVPWPYLGSPAPSGRELWEAGRHVALTAGIVTLGTITGRSDVPLLAATRPAEEVGHYAIALQLTSLLTLLASYACVVVQPRVIPATRRGALGPLVRANVLGATIVSVVAGIVTVGALPALLPLVFGERYLPALPFVQVLLLGTCADLFFMPVPMTFALQLHPRAALVGEAAITAGFFAAVSAGAADEARAMAWLVTSVRLVKLLLYFGITATGGRRKA